MDKYEKAIEYLTGHPWEIRNSWRQSLPIDLPRRIQAHCLFQFTTPSGKFNNQDSCGCLTQIRNSKAFVAPTKKLTEAIASDSRIPKTPEEIKVKHLPVFAEWQRRLDREIRGKAKIKQRK